jgi:hypothetical protein
MSLQEHDRINKGGRDNNPPLQQHIDEDAANILHDLDEGFLESDDDSEL